MLSLETTLLIPHAEMNAMEHKQPKRLRGCMMGMFFVVVEGIWRAESSRSEDKVLQFTGAWLSSERLQPHRKYETSPTRRNRAGTENALTTSTTMNHS